MYFSVGIVIFALLLILIFFGCRKRQAFKRVCSMTCMEKIPFLDSLIKPFGYYYDKKRDCIISCNNVRPLFTNRIFCCVYLYITRYFTSTPDRLLYLYYLLPFAFRRMLRPRRYCKRKKRW